MYDTILLPTDGSGPSDAAQAHAIDLAATYGSTLRAIYVIDDDALRAARIDSDVILAGFEEEGASILGDVEAAASEAGVDCETAVLHGRPFETITEDAADHGVDLIVMGTHGRHGVERVLLGSVTERVVRTSEIPVLTVRDEETDIEPTEE